MSQLRALGIVVCFIFLLSGCGYSLGGNTHSSPKRIYIQLVQNETSRASVNDQLTNKIVARLSRSTAFQIVEDPLQADLIFDGRLTRYAVSSTSYHANDEIMTYRVDLAMSATVRQRGVQGIFWRAELVVGEDYPANLDREVQQASERSAASAVCDRLADDLHARLLNELSWQTRSPTS